MKAPDTSANCVSKTGSPVTSCLVSTLTLASRRCIPIDRGGYWITVQQTCRTALWRKSWPMGCTECAGPRRGSPGKADNLAPLITIIIHFSS